MSDSPDRDPPDASPNPGTLPAPVPTKARHDGWTPERQHDFIAALAESGCVTEAAATVGMTPKSAYRLRARPDATIFRQAWDIALDYAIHRLADAAFSRALHGVSRPVFYQGEQIGERRHFDERLTMFLLRYRDPVRYGAWLDHYEARRHPDGAGITLAHALNAVADAAHGFVDPDDPDPGRPLAEGPPPPELPPLPDYQGPPEFEELFRRIRGGARDAALASEAQDPATADRRDPVATLRSRGRGAAIVRRP